MIRKKTILVSSLGRTGTTFFTRLFDRLLSDCLSVHEPDTFVALRDFSPAGLKSWLTLVGWRLRHFGIRNLILRKFDRSGIRHLSEARIAGRISIAEAARRLMAQRSAIVESFDEAVYVESNYSYHGLVDVTPQAYENHKLIYVIRDGRDWVRSQMNWKAWWVGTDSHALLGARLSALDLPADPHHHEWPHMSRFERLCWTWTTLNRYAVASLAGNPHSRLVRFEDIFEGPAGYDHLAEVVDFCTRFPDGERVPTGPLDGLLAGKVNRSQPDFPHWRDWSAEHTRAFGRICGPLMEELGYDRGPTTG